MSVFIGSTGVGIVPGGVIVVSGGAPAAPPPPAAPAPATPAEDGRPVEPPIAPVHAPPQARSAMPTASLPVVMRRSRGDERGFRITPDATRLAFLRQWLNRLSACRPGCRRSFIDDERHPGQTPGSTLLEPRIRTRRTVAP